MRYYALVVLLLITALRLGGQQRPWPMAGDIERLSESVTCVVMQEGQASFYNAEMGDATREWSLTPLKTISYSEFENLLDDPSYSFLVTTVATISNDRSGARYEFLSLLLGSEGGGLNEMPGFCDVPLCYEDTPSDEYSYMLGPLVRFIEQHTRRVMENPSGTALRDLRYYNRNVPDLKDKTILLQEDDLVPGLNSEAAIAAHYRGKVMLVDEEEIISAVEEQRKDVVVMHRVAPATQDGKGLCIKMLIGADDAVLYYYNSHQTDARNPGGLLVSDLKRISRF